MDECTDSLLVKTLADLIARNYLGDEVNSDHEFTVRGYYNSLGELLNLGHIEIAVTELREMVTGESQQKPTLPDVSDLAMAVFTLIQIKQRTEGEISRLYNFKKNEARGYIDELQEAGLIDEHVIYGDNIYYTLKGKQVTLSGSK